MGLTQDPAGIDPVQNDPVVVDAATCEANCQLIATPGIDRAGHKELQGCPVASVDRKVFYLLRRDHAAGGRAVMIQRCSRGADSNALCDALDPHLYILCARSSHLEDHMIACRCGKSRRFDRDRAGSERQGGKDVISCACGCHFTVETGLRKEHHHGRARNTSSGLICYGALQISPVDLSREFVAGTDQKRDQKVYRSPADLHESTPVRSRASLA